MTRETPSTTAGPTDADARGATAAHLRGATAADAGGATAAHREADAVLAAVGRLTGLVAEAAAWPAVDRRALLGRLDRAVDAVVAVRAAVLLVERESGAWQGGGDRSFERWRARTSRAGNRAATAQVRQAEHLGAVPSVAAAVAAGQATLDHAAAIGRVAVTGSPAQRSAVTDPAEQAHLLALAREQDADTFATTVTRWAASIDPDGLERDHEAQRRARFLHLADTPRGTMIKGQIDTMAGHRLRLALEALTPRPGADDDRDPGQRRADALDTMATGVLSDPRTTPAAHVPPHVSLILSETTWHAARTERDRRRATRVLAAAAPTPSTAARDEPATLEDGTPVPASELARVLCDCDITRIVIDADGAPLDLGRTQRLFSGPQRRAVIARDRECIWPDCHAPARWCEIHHCDWWDRDGGHTSVDRGVLLCTFHHHEVHRRDLTITRASDPPDSHRRRRSAGTLARIRYELRDPTGRVIGRSCGARQGRPAGAANPPTGEPSGAAGAQTGREPPDELDLALVTDPITGTTMPAFLLGSVP